MTLAAFVTIAQTNLGAISTPDSYKRWGTDYTITNTTDKEFTFYAKDKEPMSVNYCVDLTKGTGSHTDCTVVLYGKCFDGDSWTTIATGSSGTITTTYHLELKSEVPRRFRQFKIKFTGTGTGTTTISSQEFKYWL